MDKISVVKLSEANDRSKDFIGNLINIAPSDFSLTFFSNSNLNILNNMLINKVREITFKKYGKKIKIQPQKRHIMLTIMRYVYFQNSYTHNILDNETIVKQVKHLNELVIRRITPTVMNSLISYLKYVDRFNSLPVINDRPESGNRKRGIINEYIVL